MSGINKSKVRIVLRNPLNFKDQIDYTITPNDSKLASDWITALKELLQSGNLLEKNYCFLGFPKTARTLDYLCNEVNKSIFQINTFNPTWVSAGLAPYVIEDYFCPDAVRFSADYPITNGGTDVNMLGLDIKHSILNRLHNYFEHLQGTVENLSEYYKIADYETKYAIRQLNILCHEMESLILSQRKAVSAPQWIRPSQITTFLEAQRYVLQDEHRDGFATNKYNRQFGHVYMHWAQIGKTVFEVFRDEHAPDLNNTVCDAINSLHYYSGEFDIEWGNDIVYGGPFPWHNDEQDRFTTWLIKNGLDPNDKKLSLGYLPIGEVDLQQSFGTSESSAIWDILSQHLDIVKIEVDDVNNVFDYCWSDSQYKKMQIDMMKPGYDFSSKR